MGTHHIPRGVNQYLESLISFLLTHRWYSSIHITELQLTFLSDKLAKPARSFLSQFLCVRRYIFLILSVKLKHQLCHL